MNITMRFLPEVVGFAGGRLAPEIFIEVTDGKGGYQVWRGKLPTKVEQEDIRAEFGKLLGELARSIEMSAGYPLTNRTHGGE